MEDDVEVGRAFETALRDAAGKPDLWVPGIGNGSRGGVLKALANFSDEKIVQLVRASVASPRAQKNK